MHISSPGLRWLKFIYIKSQPGIFCHPKTVLAVTSQFQIPKWLVYTLERTIEGWRKARGVCCALKATSWQNVRRRIHHRRRAMKNGFEHELPARDGLSSASHSFMGSLSIQSDHSQGPRRNTYVSLVFPAPTLTHSIVALVAVAHFFRPPLSLFRAETSWCSMSSCINGFSIGQ